MDETVVREHARAHGQATVDGDLRRAATDLAEEARAQAADVMSQLPSPLTSAEVTSVESAADDCIVQTRYAGEDAETVVEARWQERGGRPVIVDLKVV